MTQLQMKIDSPIGSLFLTATDLGLTGVHWEQQNYELIDEKTSGLAAEHLHLAQSQLEEYFNRKRFAFDLPLDLRGTVFQQQVWSELQRIPYGETVSYTAIAERVSNKNAVRAVGSANGKNPICIIVPCHRVIAADGTLGGYSGGLDKKTKLLELEREIAISALRSAVADQSQDETIKS